MEAIRGFLNLWMLCGLLAAFCLVPACGSDDAGPASEPAESDVNPGDGDRDAPDIVDPGGQTGMEGGCAAPALNQEPPVVEPADVVALISGTHSTLLSYRDLYQATDVDSSTAELRDMTLTVTTTGEGGKNTLGECGGGFRQPVEIELAFENQNAVQLDASVVALSNEFAIMDVDLDPEHLAPLALPEIAGGTTSPSIRVAFTPEGRSGQLEFGGDDCGTMVFPPGKRCEAYRQEIPMDEVLAGFRPQEALTVLPLTVPLTWTDGSATSVSVELLDGPTHACSDAPAVNPLFILLRTRVHVTTEDGRLDLELPAAIELFVEEGWDGTFQVTAGAMFPRALLNDGESVLNLDLPERELVNVELTIQPNEASLDIHSADVAEAANPPGAPIDMTALGKSIDCFEHDEVASAKTQMIRN